MAPTKIAYTFWCEYHGIRHPEDWHARIRAGDERPMYLPGVRYGPRGDTRKNDARSRPVNAETDGE